MTESRNQPGTTTYINRIVQLTRQMIDLDTPDTGATWQALQDQRQEMVLAAIRAGIPADLIQWAIGINDTHAKVQMQRAIAHLAAEAACES